MCARGSWVDAKDPSQHNVSLQLHTVRARGSWVDAKEPPLLNVKGDKFLVRLPLRDGDHGTYSQVNLYIFELFFSSFDKMLAHLKL